MERIKGIENISYTRLIGIAIVFLRYQKEKEKNKIQNEERKKIRSAIGH